MVNWLGVVLLAEPSALLPVSIDSLDRAHGQGEVVLVLPPGMDARAHGWLRALVARRDWTLTQSSSHRQGALLNAGLKVSRAPFVFFLEAGDALTSEGAAAAARTASADAELAWIAGGVRLVSLGGEETVLAPDAANIDAFDPAHPALRGIWWQREALAAAGGFDETIAAGARYDAWLRLLGRTVRACRLHDTVVTLNADRRGSTRRELDLPDYDEAIAGLLSRHRDVVAAHVGSLLHQREQRLAQLQRRNARLLARRAHTMARLEADGRDTPMLAEASALPNLPRRLTPVSRDWGYDRGGPLDRAYIEQFLATHASAIAGAVLEVQEADYTRRFGGTRVTSSDVVDLDPANPQATVITDLRTADNLADETFDCIIITQTMHVIDDMPGVVAQCHRLLRPDGVLLATLPAVSRVCLEYGRDADFWRVTPAGARRLFEPLFGERVEVEVFGNVLASAAFLLGLAPHELAADELAFTDHYNPTLVGIRATKAAAQTPRGRTTAARDRGVVLLYHRVGGEALDPHRLSMPIDAFRDQMAWLSSNCRVMPLDALAARAADRSLPANAVAITFDDGYSDVLTHAVPILREFGLPATCFVATAGLPDAVAFWWDRLAEVLLAEGPRPSTLEHTIGGHAGTLPTRTAGERVLAHWLLYHELIALSTAERDAHMDTLEAWSAGTRQGVLPRRMSSREIETLAASEMAIGAHTVHHLQLPRLDVQTQVQEIAESRRHLEALTGRPVTAFAYPFGSFDATTVAAARQAGVELAVTCEARPVSSSADRLRLPRLEVQDSRLGHLIARLAIEQDSE